MFSSFGLILLLALLPHSHSQTANTEDRLTSAFAYLAYPTVFDGILVSQLETPVQFRALLYLNLATYNAWSNYHPTAADIFGRTRFKQPPSQFSTANKNVAIFYSLLRLYESQPQSFGGSSAIPTFRQLMRDQGLDPDDRSTNMSTPVGVGNREGMDTARLMTLDGWNADGSFTSSTPEYALPFQDYTDYVPKNTPWKLSFPLRWQPFLETNQLGFFFHQEHVVPFAGDTLAFSMTRQELSRRKVPSPYANRNARAGKVLGRDLSLLRALGREVFRVSRRLTTKQRVLAELFDNKVSAFRTAENPFGTASIAAAIRFFVLAPQLDWDLDTDVIYGLAANIATYDAAVAVWREKRRQDAVRPSGQVMEFLFGQNTVVVGGRAGEGRVRIQPREWQPYIRTMPHSEFPSASACACKALVEQSLLFVGGRDRFEYNVTVAKGSSLYGGGEFPREDVTIPINTLTEWETLCGVSRLWAGVHFKPAVEAGFSLCEGIGAKARDVVDTIVAGGVPTAWMSWLDSGAERFWEME